MLAGFALSSKMTAISMSDPSILAFTLTYTGTLAVALLMFLGQLAAFTVLLALAGAAKLLIVPVWALLRPKPRS